MHDEPRLFPCCNSMIENGHDDNCDYNPDKRTCKTCQNRVSEVKGSNLIDTCSEGVKSSEMKKFNSRKCECISYKGF